MALVKVDHFIKIVLLRITLVITTKSYYNKIITIENLKIIGFKLFTFNGLVKLWNKFNKI